MRGLPEPLNTARAFTRWTVAFGLPSRVIGRAARQGDLIARLEVDPALRADPHPGYDEVRARAAVVRGRAISGTARHGVVNQVLRSADFGVLGGNGQLPRPLRMLMDGTLDPWAVGPIDPPSLLALDPPEHERYRRLVSRAFTPRSIARHTERIQRVADDLLDRIEARGGSGFDVAEEYAARLPVAVIGDILGVPEEMHDQLLEWGNGAAQRLDPALTWRQYRGTHRDLRAMHSWLDGHFGRLREQPGDDLMSQLLALEGEQRIGERELRTTALLLLGAGFETTVNLIGNAVALLGEHPEQRERLRADPDLWGNAVEEVLRHDSPVQLTLRVAARDTEVEGVRVRAGESIVLMLGGANRDPEVFTDPHRFDVRRENAAEHLAFSSGIHFCVGAGLARMEAVIALRTLYDRFPDLAPVGTGTRRGTRVLRGFEHLPVTTGRTVGSLSD